MKKLFLTSAMIGMFVLPTYATTVTGTGTECTQPILNTDTGPATLQAQWNANTINLSWYDGNTAINPSNNAAGTCTYDEGIILPTNTMTKTGYTFAGWQVRAAAAPAQTTFDLSTLASNIEINGTYYIAKEPGGYDMPTYCDGGYSVNADDNMEWLLSEDCSDSRYSGLNAGDWKTEYSYGTIKGESRCSTEYDETGNPNPTDDLNQVGATYCWCKVTGYDSNKDGNFQNVTSSRWVLFFDSSAMGDACANICAGSCGYYASIYAEYRSTLFGISQ